MSRNVKYISSSHFGTPIINGDTWGYTVNVLRKCLVEGFNIRNDITAIDVLDIRYIKITFATPHNYVTDQTIQVGGTILDFINQEFRIASYDELSITAESHIEFNPYNIGILINSFENVTTKVAPLGFIEKFTSNNRSVFTTDEDEAYLYIDDEVPTQWDGSISAGYKPLVCPLIFMTDKMDNIDDFGSSVVPYDTINPDKFKVKDWIYTDVSNVQYKKTGIWNWVTYGANSASGNNTIAQQTDSTKWSIIGNGRLFYFICYVKYSTTIHTHIYMFGKINSSKERTDDLKYVLNTTGYNGDYNIYHHNRIRYAASKYFLESSNIFTAIYGHNTQNIGRNYIGVLKSMGTSTQIHCNPYLARSYMVPSGSLSVSNIAFPDRNTKKIYISNYHVTTNNGYIGKLSGAKFVHNADINIHLNGNITKYNLDGKIKKYFCINDTFPSSETTTTTDMTQKIMFISLNNEDWYNYD